MLTSSERQYNDALRRAEERLAAYRERHARSLAALGMVRRSGNRFRVREITARLKRPAYTVWRHEKTKRVRCTCEDFKGHRKEAGYRCAHILAVKLHVAAAREAAAQAATVVDINTARPSAEREATTPRRRRRARLPRNPELLAARCAWTSVADTLDRVAPHWTHHVMLVAASGPRRVKVVAAVTAGYITRLGTGWGAPNAAGVRKAEDDALKQAATRFRTVAAALIETDGGDDPAGGGGAQWASAAERLGKTRGRPEAKSRSTLVTPKQLDRIRQLERDAGLPEDEQAQLIFGCPASALAKRFASVLIEHLEEVLDETMYEHYAAA